MPSGFPVQTRPLFGLMNLSASLTKEWGGEISQQWFPHIFSWVRGDMRARGVKTEPLPSVSATWAPDLILRVTKTQLHLADTQQPHPYFCEF